MGDLGCRFRLSQGHIHLGLSPGLSLENQELKLSSAYFSCCAASGAIDDRATNTLRVCPLRFRYAGIKSLLARWEAIWPEHSPDFLFGSDSAYAQAIVQRLKLFLLSRQGPQALRLKLYTEGPTALWHYAIAAIWHFNLKVFIFNARKDRVWLPPRTAFAELDTPLILLEHLPPYQVNQAETMEAMENLLSLVYTTQSALIFQDNESPITGAQERNYTPFQGARRQAVKLAKKELGKTQTLKSLLRRLERPRTQGT